MAPHRTLWMILGVLVPLTALAQPERAVRLRWEAPATCPQREAVASRIATLAGRAAQNTRELDAEGTITRVGDQFRLELVVRDGEAVGRRSLESRSCQDLAGAAAVALALLLRSSAPLTSGELAGEGHNPDATRGAAGSDASAPAGADEPTDEATPRSEARSEAAPATAPQPANRDSALDPEEESVDPDAEREDGEPRRWRLVLQAPLGQVEVGSLPRATWSGGAAAGVLLAHWRLLLEGAVSLPSRVPAPDLPRYGARVHRATATLTTCRGVPLHRFELSPCLSLTAQRLTARGDGDHVSASSAQVTTWAAGVGAMAHYWWVPDLLAVVAGASLRLQASKPRLWLEGLGQVHQIPPFHLTGSLGLEWIL